MTARVVQKFGGTSVADVARLQSVAQKVAMEANAGRQVAVVVSAMSGVTNQLVSYTQEISTSSHTLSHDVVLSTGEQITTGLLSLALQQLGLKSEPFMGWQIPIVTDAHHTNANIQCVHPERIRQALENGVIPVVAGFQGVTEEGRLTTLGRGGSDTTAVALAGSLQADVCDIYTDVDGVYTADPRLVPKARKLEVVTYDEMIELSRCGAKVMHDRSVKTAKDQKVPVRVLSSFHKGYEGTRIVSSREILEDTCVSGIVLGRDEVHLTLVGLSLVPHWQDLLPQWFSDCQIPIDMLSFALTTAGKGDVSFMMPKGEVGRLKELLRESPWKIDDLSLNEDRVRLSVVGHGLSHHLGVASTVFQVIHAQGIPTFGMSTYDTKISVILPVNAAQEICPLIHTALGLDRLD